MLKKLFSKIFGSNEPALTEKQAFEKENGISNHYGFACHGLLVREFNHHLRFYSENQVDDFEDVSKILNNKEKIISNVKKAIANNDLPEKGLVDDELALLNAKNFLKIFETVVLYNLRFNPDFYYMK